MSIKSKEDVIRKRNQELAAENERLKNQMAEIQNKLEEISRYDKHEEVKKKIDELEELHKEWSDAIEDLNKQREKCRNLIHDLQIIKDIMQKRGFKIPWFQKFFEQI